MKKDRHGGDVLAAAAALGVDPASIVDFSSSVNPLGPPRAASAAYRRAIKALAAYPDPEARELKRALAARHGVDAGSIVPANGSTELIHALPSALGVRRALIIRPAFSEYERAIEAAGASAASETLLEEEGYALDPSRLAARLSTGRFHAVYIANPSNPLGALTPRAKVLELARLCKKRGAALVVDEAFADFAEGESVKEEAARTAGLIVLRSLTKFYALAGLRVGFAVANRRAAVELSRRLPPWSINAPAQAAAVAALTDAAYPERTIRLIEKERAFLLSSFAAIPGLTVYGSAANYLTAKLPSGRRASTVRALMLGRSLLIRDLTNMAGLGSRFIRVAVRNRRDNVLLVEGLKAVLSKKR